jgi:hypothetical protein
MVEILHNLQHVDFLEYHFKKSENSQFLCNTCVFTMWQTNFNISSSRFPISSKVTAIYRRKITLEFLNLTGNQCNRIEVNDRQPNQRTIFWRKLLGFMHNDARSTKRKIWTDSGMKLFSAEICPVITKWSEFLSYILRFYFRSPEKGKKCYMH